MKPLLAFFALVSVASAQSPYVRIEGPSGNGSGCVVVLPKSGLKDRIIVSCAHPFKGKGEQVTVTMSRTKQVSGVIVAYDKELDLALIEAEEYPWRQLQIMEEAPEEGTAILVGYGNGRFHEKRGEIVGTSRAYVDGVRRDDLVKMEVAGRPGDSGGPVIFKGKLAGIHCAGHKNGTESWFVPAELVRVLILEYAGER